MTTPRILPSRRSIEVAVASALGLSSPMAREFQREGMWWAWARLQAARNRRPLRGGRAIGWTSTGYTELLPFEESRACAGRVTVLMEYSVVSPGTERARYLRLPNTSLGSGMPGYSGAGIVLEVGRGVTHVAEGMRVAVAKAHHASIATVAARDVYALPDGVDPRAAATVFLGIICGQAATRAGVRRGDRVCIVGAGPIGVLAQRISVARGAVPVAAIARSRRREALLAVDGIQLVLADDQAAIANLNASVVFDATGGAESIATAVAAVAPDGRLVLLGSPRGATRVFPLDEIRRKRLQLVGAHVDNASRDEARREGEDYLRMLAEGAVRVDDLIGDPVDPRDAALFYRELARNGDIVGGYFDWTRLSMSERVSRAHLLRPPSVRAKGIDFERRPLKAPRGCELLTPGDPLADASGMLRLGFLGCGDVSLDNAAGASLAPNVELVACYDPVSSLAEEVARRSGARVAASVDDVLGDPAVDAVMIAVPHHLHAALAIEAARAGKHVIVEKPAAQNLAAAVAMADEAARAGVALTVCFPRRYHPNALVARRLVEEGVVGELCGAHIRLFADRPPGYWITGYHGRSSSDWRSSPEKAGGGVLIMNVSHYIDLMYALTGVGVDAVAAVAASPDEHRDVEESISLSVRFANGATGSVVGYSAVRGVDYYTELRLWGRDGHIGVEPRGQVFTLRPAGGLRTARWQTFSRVSTSEARVKAAFLSRFATALDRGIEPDVTVDQALAVQAFIEAAYRSSRERREIAIAEALEDVRS